MVTDILAVVQLTTSVTGDDGSTIAEGQQGTVVEITRLAGEDECYLVEFLIIDGDGERWEIANVLRSQCRLVAPAPPPSLPPVQASVPVTPVGKGPERMVGQSVRLLEVAQADRGEALEGLLLPVGVCGRIISYSGKIAGHPHYRISFTVPSQSIYGYCFVRAIVARRGFEMTDPANASRVQDISMPHKLGS